MRLRRALGAWGVGALLAFAGAALAAPAAFAHDTLVDSNPEAETSVDSLSEVTLEFNNAPIDGDGGTIVRVTGPDGRYYESDCPVLRDNTVTTPAALGEPGEYLVQWRVVSSDGHPIDDEFRFTYAPTDDAEVSDGADAPACGDAEPAPTEQSKPDASDAGGDGLWIGLGIGGGVIVLLGLGIWAILGSSRHSDES